MQKTASQISSEVLEKCALSLNFISRARQNALESMISPESKFAPLVQEEIDTLRPLTAKYVQRAKDIKGAYDDRLLTEYPGGSRLLHLHQQLAEALKARARAGHYGPL